MLAKAVRSASRAQLHNTTTRRTFAEEARKQQDVQVSQGESGKGVATRTRPRGVSDPRDWFFGHRSFPMTFPFTSLDRNFFEPFDSLFDRDFTEASRMLSDFQPKVDVSEDDKSTFVHAELPGLNKTDVSLNIQDGVLEIKGSKNIEKKSEGRTFRKTERTYGSFVRRLPIDKSVKPEEVKAKFENGVLEVTVPKKQHAEKEGAIPIE